MAMDNTAAKAAKLREMAKDKSLPQDVRNTYLDEAVKIEEKAATKAGVKLAKGGAVGKAPAKKPAAKTPAVVIAVGVGKPKGKAMMNKGGMAKKGKC